MLLTTIALIGILAGLIYVFLTWNFGYFKKRGINGPTPAPLLGNFPSIFTQKRHMVYELDDIYRTYKKDEDFVGIFSSRSPQLMITSPALAHRVLVNDFKHFHDNEPFSMIDESTDYLFANNPFVLTGEKWKQRRAEISPGLTVNRIKNVYPVSNKICKTMTDYIRDQMRMAPKDGIEAKDLSLRFTSDLVTDCVLGLSAESFSDKPTPVMGMIEKLFDQSFSLIISLTLVTLFPAVNKLIKFRFIPKIVEEFFVDLMQNAVKLRQSQKQADDRVDFLNYLLQLQEKKRLSTWQLAAHTMTFLLDGFETTAAVLAHALLLLGRYPAAQEKLLAEINEHLDDKNELNFETLNDLPYLDACVHESIRIFPPVFVSNKLCTEPIELTNKNGRTHKLEKGDSVVLPFYSFMMDEEYYDKPQEFQPERFIQGDGVDAVKKYREMGLYYGFGDGPRVCLGMRFALAQVKAALAAIVRNYNVRVNPKTRTDNNYDPKYFLVKLDGGVWLDYEPRN